MLDMKPGAGKRPAALSSLSNGAADVAGPSSGNREPVSALSRVLNPQASSNFLLVVHTLRMLYRTHVRRQWVGNAGLHIVPAMKLVCTLLHPTFSKPDRVCAAQSWFLRWGTGRVDQAHTPAWGPGDKTKHE